MTSSRKLIPILFTPGMLTSQALWSNVWSRLTVPQKKIFVDFSQCKTLEEQLKQFDAYLTPYDLVGFSMGGYIAIEKVLRQPQHISSLVLIGSSARGYNPVEKEQRAKLIQAAARQFADIISPARLSNWLSSKNAGRQDLIEILQTMARTAGAQEFIGQQTATLDRLDRRELLSQVTIPTLIIHGADDKLIPVAQAEALAKAMPNATLEIIPSAGHMVPLEEPDRLAEILTKWYQQQQLEMEKKKMTASRPLPQDSKDADLKVYTLRRGSEGEGRLNVLNGIYNDNSERFLLANNISSAKQVLDIGCGTGQMACWIAQRNPDCHVTCLDISPDQIRVARRNAEKKGLKNMSFDTVSVYELEKLQKQYDFIYTRFVLAHLDKNRTEEAFESIKTVLAPGGVLAIEEAKTTAHLCNPANATFDRYYKLWSELRMKKGSNPNLGSQLKDFMELVGLEGIAANEVTRDLTYESGLRSIFVLNLQEIGAEAIRQNLITKEELDTLIADMSELIKDESLQMRFSASIQTAGKAPALENTLRKDPEPVVEEEVTEHVSRMGFR